MVLEASPVSLTFALYDPGTNLSLSGHDPLNLGMFAGTIPSIAVVVTTSTTVNSSVVGRTRMNGWYFAMMSKGVSPFSSTSC